jgi:hypothetical protein
MIMPVEPVDATTRRRSIGRCGTAARVLAGGGLVGSVALGSLTGDGGFRVESWLGGLVGIPILMIGGQLLWSRRRSGRLVALTGPVGHLVTLAGFLTLYGTTWYAPPIDFVSDAALLFFGSSMLVAAGRGSAGCEVLSISNWVVARDDQIGCVVFDAIDRVERPT